MKRVFKNSYGELRSGWLFGFGLVLTLLGLLAAGLLTELLFGSTYQTIVEKPIGYAVVDFMYYLAQEGAMVGASVLAFFIVTRRGAVQLGFSPRHLGKKLVHGLVAGGVPIALTFGVLLLTRQVEVAGFHAAAFGNINWWSKLPAYILVGIGEETLCRGFMMTALKPSRKAWVIVLLPALLFSLLHLLNPDFAFLPFLNIVLAGLFFAVMFLRTGSLWAPIAAHFIWNWLQGPVFGMNVSGTDNISLLETLPTGGTILWNGGGFGAEGGLVVSIVLLAGIALYLFVLKTPADAPWTLESDLPFTRRQDDYLYPEKKAVKKGDK